MECTLQAITVVAMRYNMTNAYTFANTPSMTPSINHPNAPLTPEGRERLCRRVDAGVPLAHVADEGGIARSTLTKWYGRWKQYGPQGLHDRSSEPTFQPTATDPDIVEMVLQVRRVEKWGADRIAAFLATVGDGSILVSPATVHRILERHGISRLRDLDMPTGETKRPTNSYEHEQPGDMIHVDIKKVGRIPDGGGWFVHGRGTPGGNASQTVKNKRKGYAYIHAAVDDHSRLAYAEVLPNEQKETCAEFWFRAVAFFREHGIYVIARCLTDNGPAYRSNVFNDALKATNTVHKYTRPHTPRTNGKVERFNLTMKTEWLYVRPYSSEEERTARLAEFLNYYNHERPHSSLDHKPPASRVPETTHRIMPQLGIPETPTTEGLGYEPNLFDLLED